MGVDRENKKKKKKENKVKDADKQKKKDKRRAKEATRQLREAEAVASAHPSYSLTYFRSAGNAQAPRLA
jgi:hypothetical protein